jgi:hypothetical protein
MTHRVCPRRVGYFLLNPLRKWFEDPQGILDLLVWRGMTVFEPWVGYFTLPAGFFPGSPGGAEAGRETVCAGAQGARPAICQTMYCCFPLSF